MLLREHKAWALTLSLPPTLASIHLTPLQCLHKVLVNSITGGRLQQRQCSNTNAAIPQKGVSPMEEVLNIIHNSSYRSCTVQVRRAGTLLTVEPAAGPPL